MLAAMERRRVYDQWHGRYLSIFRAMPYPFHTEDPVQEAEQLAGPKPEYEPAERVSLHECDQGQWSTVTDDSTEIAAFDTKDVIA